MSRVRGQDGRECPACGASAGRGGRFCGRCGASVSEAQGDSGPRKPGWTRWWPAAALAGLLLVGLAMAVQLDGLPSFGEDDPGAVTLPQDFDPEERTFPGPGEATDAEGNPRCHTATVVVDCVSWSVTIPGASQLRFAQRLGDREVLAFGEPNVIAMVDLDEPAVRWTYETAGGFAPSVVAGEMLVVEGGRTLTGVDLATGTVRWERDDLDDDVEQSDPRPPLQLVTGNAPGVFVEVAGQQDRLLRLDASDGTTRWELPLGANENLELVAGTLLAVTQQPMPDDAAGGAAPSRPPAAVRSLDLDTGETRWRVEGQPVAPYRSRVSEPTAGSPGPAIVLLTGDRVQVIDSASGEPLFDVAGIAAAVNGSTLVVREGIARLAAYDLESGELRWSAELDDAPGDNLRADRLHIVDGFVVLRAGNDAMFAVLDLDRGELRYRFDRGDGASMMLADGDTAAIAAANLAGWSIHQGSLAAVHQRGPVVTLWLVDLENQQLQEATVGDQRGQPWFADDVLVLFEAPVPTFRHREDLGQAWQLTAEGFTTIFTDPLLIGNGDTLHAIELPPPSS